MIYDEIVEVLDFMDDDDIDAFLDGLTSDDWLNFTDDEYDVLFDSLNEKEEIIDFVNDMIEKDHQIVG